MQPFKFLNDNKKDDYITPTMDEIANALSVGRRAYLEGRSVDYNPFLRLELSDAFDEGWQLEHSYDILRDVQQRANNETI
jgi:ribosome modulation factor